MKKILIACEESQAVTIEFRKLGFEAFSCDILNCSGGFPQWHIKDDIFNVIDNTWDLMVAFPPCTDLAISGAKHFKQKKENGTQQKSIDFFMKIVNAPINKIAIENPISIMSKIYKKPDQIIQPYFFGDKAQKTTCLWLKNLPILKPTEIVEKGEFYEFISKKGIKKRMPLWYFEALKKSKTSEERKILRSKTFKGIAKAMAKQWSNF